MYVEAREHVNNLIDQAKSVHFRTKIEEAGDQKNLFKVVEGLLHHKSASILPSCDSDLELADKFNDFFASKVTKLRDNLPNAVPENNQSNDSASDTTIIHELTELRPATEEEVEKVVKGSKTKSCSLDPIPTQLLKGLFGGFTPHHYKAGQFIFRTIYYACESEEGSCNTFAEKSTSGL